MIDGNKKSLAERDRLDVLLNVQKNVDTVDRELSTVDGYAIRYKNFLPNCVDAGVDGIETND